MAKRPDTFLSLVLRFCPPDTRDEVRRVFATGREKVGSDVGVFLFAVTLLDTAFGSDDVGSGKEQDHVG